MNRPASRPHRRRRSKPLGFTLVELLVVLLILAVLIALLFPAITGAVRKARGAAVQSEINNLGQALTEFKNKFGDYPPSRIIVNENGFLNTSATGTVVPSAASGDISLGQLAARTLTSFRKFWPRAPFSTSGAIFANGSQQWYDFNGDGVPGANTTRGIPPGPWILQGHECLAFFLGGIPLVSSSNGVTSVSLTGFAKNPTNPFMNSITTSTNYNGNRNPPFYEFDPNRLKYSLVSANGSILPSGYVTPGAFAPSGIPGYIDSIASQGSGDDAQNFYAYFSNNLGSGYDPNDFNIVDSRGGQFEVDDATTPLLLSFRSVQPASAAVVASPTPNPYTTGPSVPGNAAPTFVNPQTFQIISPGVDGVYGMGGTYVANGTTPMPVPGPLPAPLTGPSSNTQNRAIESDNLTNFHNGTLE